MSFSRTTTLDTGRVLATSVFEAKENAEVDASRRLEASSVTTAEKALG